MTRSRSGHLPINGLQLYYEAHGDLCASEAVPLLLIPGAFMSTDSMKQWVAAFVAKRPVATGPLNGDVMDKATVQAMLTRMFEEMDPDVEYVMRHPDFVADMPQSGERFASREALREMQRAFPDPPKISLRRLVGEGDVWVAEATSDYSGQRFHTVLILEIRDDLILRETRYYAEPFEAPEWRANWVHTMPEE
jgi:SnoaL-like domain